MKYCPFCGKQISDEAVFCPVCGKRVYTPDADQGTQNANSQSGTSKTFESEYCNGGRRTTTTTQTTVNNPATDSYSVLTILGFVFTFLSPLIGLILSICANNEAKRTGSGKNQSLSRTGIILSSVFFGLIALVCVFYFVIILIGISYGGVLLAV
ncbi:MAG: zinc-ribbon domain-containing protein [Candidatus Coproplasma sp.]